MYLLLILGVALFQELYAICQKIAGAEYVPEKPASSSSAVVAVEVETETPAKVCVKEKGPPKKKAKKDKA